MMMMMMMMLEYSTVLCRLCILYDNNFYDTLTNDIAIIIIIIMVL